MPQGQPVTGGGACPGAGGITAPRRVNPGGASMVQQDPGSGTDDKAGQRHRICRQMRDTDNHPGLRSRLSLLAGLR